MAGAGALQGAAMVGVAVAPVTGPSARERCLMGRRPGEAGAGVAAARTVGEATEAADLVMDRMAAHRGGSMTARTALGGGAQPSGQIAMASFPQVPLSVQPGRASIAERMSIMCRRGEFEKRGGAGRGNWGTEAEEIKE